jgi:diaminopimelate epimerase
MKLTIYNACGNIIGILTNPHKPFPKEILKLCDQLLVYHAPRIKIYNQDGSKATQCGNGLRALAHHLGEKNNTFYIENTPYQSWYRNHQHWLEIPLPQQITDSSYQNIPYKAINVGNLHALFGQNMLPHYPKLTPLQQTHNISFLEIIGQNIHIKTYERGVGFTASCGSAAAASAFLAQSHYPNIHTWKIQSKGGELITNVDQSILQTGPVSSISHINI